MFFSKILIKYRFFLKLKSIIVTETSVKVYAIFLIMLMLGP